MKTAWLKSSNDYYFGEISDQVQHLPIGIYNLRFNPNRGLYLSRTDDDFKFNHKIYGIESSFVNRVKKTWDNVDDNLGVLLNGVKGTGKSVTSKLICNAMQLPVIMIDTPYDNIPMFLSQIQQEFVLFIDEYEKIYKESSEVLTLMDGMFKTQYKRLFLLTTNELYINRNMLQRPGRVRYLKTYGDLKPEIVEEIVDDLLINKSFKQACIDEISRLSIITIDLVKSIIQEVNIHNEAPENFIEFMNVKNAYEDRNMDVSIKIVEKGIVTDKFLMENYELDRAIERINPGFTFYNNSGTYFGSVVEKCGPDMFKLRTTHLLPDAEDLDDRGRISKDAYNEEDIIEHNGKQYIRSHCGLKDSDLTLFTYVKIEENKKLHYSYIKY